MRNILLLLFAFLLIGYTDFGQCNVTITPSATTVPCGGGSVTLTANGSGFSTPVLDNTFDAGNAGPGWNVSPAGQFNNPCDPSFDGGTYMWMGNTTAAPRTLETVGLDVSCGGTICFYLDYATQGGASPCEGPDLSNEGVYFEYSVDGGTSWNTINYFDPGSGYDPTLTAWNQYCYPIPAGAQTSSTIFHWYQTGSSGTCCDHWGIDNVTITANGCGTPYYDWTNIPGTTAPTGDPATQTVNVVSDTSFTVYYTDGGGFNCSQTVNITVLGMGVPTVSITPETCMGDNDGTATITANGGSPNYTFDIVSGPATPPSQTTTGSATFSNLPPGNYTVDVTDNGGCVVSNTFTVVAGASCCPMSVSATSVNSLCNSANASCSGSATVTQTGGAGTISYQWYDGSGTPISGGTSATITGLCAGTYSVDVTDLTPCTLSATVTITEPTALSFTSTTTNSTCGNANGSLTISGTGGTGTLTYSIDGTNYQSSGTFSGLLAGGYTGYVQDANGCIFSSAIIVNNNASVTLDSIVTSDPLCNGSSDGSITVYTTGGVAPINYSINGGTTQTSNLFNSLAAGSYDVMVQDGSGCFLNQTVQINDPLALNYSTILTNLTCFQFGDGVIEFDNVSGGTGAYNFSIDGGVTSQPDSLFSNLSAGTYNLQLTDANNCSITSTETITEPTGMSWVISTTNPTCNGGSDGWINVIPNGGTQTSGYNYIWTPSSIATSTSPLAQNLTSGTYLLSVTDDNGCQLDTSLTLTDPVAITVDNVAVTDELCQGDCQGAISITSALAASYEIQGPTGTLNNFSGNFTGLCSGNYNITVYDVNNCPATQTTNVSSQAPITITVSSDTTICIGGAASLVSNAQGGVGGLTYTWDNSLPSTASNVVSPSTTSVYSVFATDANGCVSPTVSSVVNVLPPLDVLAFSNQAICPGESALISAIGSGGNGGPYTYSWSQGVGAGSNQTVSPAFTTNYIVTVSDGCETPSDTASVTITVNSLPNPDFTVDTSDLCMPGTFNFSEINSNPSYSCLWNFGDGNVSTSCGNVSNEYMLPGCYDVTLTVTSDSNCVNSITYPQLVCVHDFPTSSFLFGPQPTSFVTPEISFENTSSSNSYSYYWTFGTNGELGDTNAINPVFSFPNTGPGTYEVCLVATTAFNCSDTSCQNVVIDDEYLIYVPNAFTPDGDGVNDVFLPKLQGFDPLSYSLMIFDRWGELIFESHHKDFGWDGKYQNVLSKTDVYVWKLEVKDAVSGQLKTYYGHVSLLK